MISPAAIEQSFASAREQFDALAERVYDAIITCTVYHTTGRNQSDGAEETYFRVVKPVAGFSVGQVVSLRELHKRLFTLAHP